ncbi:MAG TPA: YciI family protein [Telluria sp.]|nr:YciI family protein [Telluria sp.]
MHFMILRRADPATEQGARQGAELLRALKKYHEELGHAGVLRGAENLAPSAQAVRLKLSTGEATVVDGPFQTSELFSGFSIIDVASRQEAIDWARRWPVADGAGEVELEIRQTGCPGGCAEVKPEPPANDAQLGQRRFAILLRSNQRLESAAPVAQEKLDALDRSNEIEAKAGVLLAGEGLQPSAKGARIKFSGGKPLTIDGPFTEMKEMIAGFWLIRAASMDDAIAWARRNPYPTLPEVEVEIREVPAAADAAAPAAHAGVVQTA